MEVLLKNDASFLRRNQSCQPQHTGVSLSTGRPEGGSLKTELTVGGRGPCLGLGLSCAFYTSFYQVLNFRAPVWVLDSKGSLLNSGSA